jgi:hypothetical protein
MGTMKFDETWWTVEHGMLGANEKRHLLRTWPPLSKDWILP